MGVSLVLFYRTLCIPLLVAAAWGSIVCQSIGGRQCYMLMIAGILLVVGAICVFAVKDRTLKQVESANPREDFMDM